jgi:hypothetical protein
MAKQVIFNVLGVVVGIVGGMIFMMFLHWTTTFIHPLPEGVSFMDSGEETWHA